MPINPNLVQRYDFLPIFDLNLPRKQLLKIVKGLKSRFLTSFKCKKRYNH